MSDYIPRQYAIVALENQIQIKREGEKHSPLIEAYNAGYRTAMQQAKLELMAIKAKTDWIDIEERGLPKKRGIYLISDTMHCVSTAEFEPNVTEDRQWWSVDFNQYIRGVIAWMPKPEAYRKRVIKNG